VDVPGALDQETSDALRQTAAMSFRPVLGAVAPEGSEEQDPSDGGGDGAEGTDEASTATADPSQQQFEGLIETDPSLAPAPTGDDGTGAEGLPYPAWSMDWLTPDMQTELMAADCVDPSAQQEEVSAAAPDEP